MYRIIQTMSMFTSSLPVLGRSSCCRHNPFTHRLLSSKHKYKSCFGIKWRPGSQIFKGAAVVTGASAATCAILYLSLGPSGQENFWNLLRLERENIWDSLDVIELKSLIKNRSNEIDMLDLFYQVGLEDDWLAVHPSIFASQSKAINESSAFVKPNMAEHLFLWEHRKEDPWVLLQLTKSSNFWVRQMGVACLAEKTDWEAYKYRYVAQACDFRTVIALARYQNASDAYFLPQPKLCPAKTDILTEIKNLLCQMPEPDTVKCNISFYRDLALQKEIPTQKDPSSMDLLTHFYTLPGEEEKKKEKGLRHCIQALEAYTAEAPYAAKFLHLNGLALLQRLYEEVKDNWVHTRVFIILSNLSLIGLAGKHFVASGWVQKLREWSKSSNTTFSIMADTILANLDRDAISSDLYQNMILLHPTHRNSQPVDVDIVLVHGLRGGAVKTWRQRDEKDNCVQTDYSYCWPKDWLSQEFQNARVISVGYNSSLHQWGEQSPYESFKRTLDGRGEELLQHLLKAGVGTRPIIWIGHSMGGLLIKEILQLAEKSPSYECIVDQTKGLVMYSVPHKGSPVIDTILNAKYILFPSVEVQEMKTGSPKLKRLHDEFIRMVSEYFIPCLSFGEDIKTEIGKPFPGLLLVPKDSSDPGIGEYIHLTANHIETCKPCCKDDPMYIYTLSFLRKVFESLY